MDARSTGARHGSCGRATMSDAPPLDGLADIAPDEDPLDRLVDRAPLVLVRLVAAKGVEPPTTVADRPLGVGNDHENARRQPAGLQIDAAVVIQVAVGP